MQSRKPLKQGENEEDSYQDGVVLARECGLVKSLFIHDILDIHGKVQGEYRDRGKLNVIEMSYNGKKVHGYSVNEVHELLMSLKDERRGIETKKGDDFLRDVGDNYPDPVMLQQIEENLRNVMVGPFPRHLYQLHFPHASYAKQI